MGYSQQDDKQFKASMLRIEGIADGRTKAGRHFAGVHYRWNEKDVSEGKDEGILF
tara:strand:+ start:19 stop:183 length:165 start_codon:yes stop_codon:yes gene_type:complete